MEKPWQGGPPISKSIFLPPTISKIFSLVLAKDKSSSTKISADAYLEQQRKISQAIYMEGKAEAEGIQKMNAALAEQGGKIMVKLEMAKALSGKPIYLLPCQ